MNNNVLLSIPVKVKQKMVIQLLLLFATVSGYNYQVFNNFDYGHGKSDSLQVPNFLSKNETFSAKIGSDIIFPCKVDKRDSTYKMIFMYISHSGEDRIIYAGNVTLAHNPRIHKNGFQFVLEKIRKSDAGKYICRFETNPVMILVHILDVQYPPVIRRQGADVQRVLKGSKITLACVVEGHPIPTVTWYHSEGRLASKTFSTKGASIIFPRVERSEEGTYTCTANNGVGDLASSSIKLLVEFLPEVKAKQALRYASDGVEAQLTCIVHGRPKPSLSWLRGDSVVSSQKHVMTHDGGNRHTLTISGVTQDDFGEYSCKARNIHGIMIKELEINGLPLKPVIISNKEGQMDDMYALAWQTESLAPILQYRITLWKVPLNPEKKRVSPLSDMLYIPGNGTFEATYIRHPAGKFKMRHPIEHLHSSEDYEVAIRVENKFGWSDESQRFSFTTKRRVFLGLSTSGGIQYQRRNLYMKMLLCFSVFYSKLMEVL